MVAPADPVMFPACNDNQQVLFGTLSLEPLWLHRSRDASWLFLTVPRWGSGNPMAADLWNSMDISLTACCSLRSFHGSQGRKSRELLLNLSYPRYVHFYFPGILKDRLLRNFQCRGTVPEDGLKHNPAWTKGTNGQNSCSVQEHWLGHQRVSSSICGSAPEDSVHATSWQFVF